MTKALHRCTVKKTRVDIRGKAVEIKESGSEGAIITTGQRGEKRTQGSIGDDAKISETGVELPKAQKWGSPQRKCARCQMCVRSETMHPRENRQDARGDHGWDEKEKYNRGERGPRPDEDWLTRALSGKGKLQSTAEGIKCP